jgi:hypothetical protein
MPDKIHKLILLKALRINPEVPGINNLFTASKVIKKLYGRFHSW